MHCSLESFANDCFAKCARNVAVKFEETGAADQFRMLGRGELQFAILIEQMRREGGEFMVGVPKS